MAGERLVGVFGTGGFGREVMPFVRSNVLAEGLRPEQLVFIDDKASEARCAGHDVLTFEEFCRREAGRREAVLAIGDGALRERLAARCRDAGVALATAVAGNATMLDNVSLGEGAVICPYAMITSDVVIGRLFQANIYSYVAHDCVVGDSVTIAPGAKVNGNVHLEDGVYIGTGAILRQGAPGKPLVVGKNAIVGMGAVVTKDVAPGATVVGNPARPLG